MSKRPNVEIFTDFFFQLDFTARKRCFLKSAQKNYFSGGGITEQQKQPKFVSLKDFKMKNWGGGDYRHHSL